MRRKKFAAGYSLAGAALILNIATAFAQSVSVAEHYPAGSIHSTEAAELALANAARERAGVEARYGQEVQSCSSKFFATSCIDDAQERRRLALQAIRSVEVEANEFKRRERVIQRDKALAERRAKELEKQQKGVASGSASPKPETRAPFPDTRPVPKSGKAKPDDRQARHEARLRSIREREAADAAERSRNVAAYEQKLRDAHERQLEVARKKAEKDQKHATQATNPAVAR